MSQRLKNKPRSVLLPVQRQHRHPAFACSLVDPHNCSYCCAANHTRAGQARGPVTSQGELKSMSLFSTLNFQPRIISCSVSTALQAELRANVFLAINDQDVRQGGSGRWYKASCSKQCDVKPVLSSTPGRYIQASRCCAAAGLGGKSDATHRNQLAADPAGKGGRDTPDSSVKGLLSVGPGSNC